MAGSYTNLIYHVVFSTKNRQRFLTPSVEEEIHRYMAGIVRNLDGVCLEINGMHDHVHLLLKLPAKLSLADALRTIKANASKWIHVEKPELSQFAWQDGYAAFSVSASQVETVREYVRNQKTHHATNDFKRELVSLLEKHGVEYDAKYLLG